MRALSLLALCAATPLGAQALTEANVPAPVRSAFHARYAGNATIKWRAVGGEQFEAIFQLKGFETRARYAATGAWIQTATVIGAISLPDSVRATLVREFKGYRIEEARSVVYPEPPTQLFEVDFSSPRGAVTGVFERAGSLREKHPLKK